MHVLVAYASRHGATRGIAERLGQTLRDAGLDADVIPVADVGSVAGYDAFVIGSAAYMFHWLKEAMGFVHRNGAVLAAKPVWLFSSGPLGSEPIDAKGRDQKVTAVPKEFRELIATLTPRGERIFFGAYQKDRKPIGLGERFVGLIPTARDALPEGDFRNWADIDAWANEIATGLGTAVIQSLGAPAALGPQPVGR